MSLRGRISTLSWSDEVVSTLDVIVINNQLLVLINALTDKNTRL